MEDGQTRQKLEISGFTPREIRPEPGRGKPAAADAGSGRMTQAVGRAVRSAKSIGGKLGLRRDGAEDDGRAVRRLVVKTAVCAAIVLLLLLVKNIDSPFTNAIAREVKSAVTTQTDLEKEIGRLKFVQNLFGSEPVISEIIERSVYPVEGKVVKKFNEDGSKGITVETALHSPVLCAAGGTVESLQKENNGTTLRIRSQDGTEILYKGIVPDVKEGDGVEKGAILGTLKGNVLTLEVYRDGVAVDPIAYLGNRGLYKE